MRSSAGDLHPVIRIAGHGTVPVCARRSAPFVPESCRISAVTCISAGIASRSGWDRR